MRGCPREVFHPCVRRGWGLTRFRFFSVVVWLSCRCRVVVVLCCRHPTLFFIKRVCNNDFGVFRKSPEAKFRSGSLEKLPGSNIGHPTTIFAKKPKIPKIPKIKNLQNRPENQQLGPKLIQDDSPSLNNKFPTIFDQFPNKNPPKIFENPFTSMP